MFELPPLPRILPLGAILFDFLFILVAIPVEAYVLNKRLNFDKKTSAFYAISLNVFSTVIGWIVFFFVEPVLPVQLKSELINFAFFNRLQSPNIQSIIILTAFIIFFGTFFAKYILLRILLLSLNEPKKNEPSDQIPQRRNSRRAFKTKLQNTNLVTTILIANSLSYSLIVSILFMRSLNL